MIDAPGHKHKTFYINKSALPNQTLRNLIEIGSPRCTKEVQFCLGTLDANQKLKSKAGAYFEPIAELGDPPWRAIA
jgi:hypothetical protein